MKKLDPMNDPIFQADMSRLYSIKDAAVDLYEACLAIKRAESLGRGWAEALDILDKAIERAEAEKEGPR